MVIQSVQKKKHRVAASWEGKTGVLPDDHRGTFGSENIMPNGCLTIEPKPETTATNLVFTKKNRRIQTYFRKQTSKTAPEKTPST